MKPMNKRVIKDERLRFYAITMLYAKRWIGAFDRTFDDYLAFGVLE